MVDPLIFPAMYAGAAFLEELPRGNLTNLTEQEWYQRNPRRYPLKFANLYGGFGDYASARLKPKDDSFNSTLGYPGEGPPKRASKKNKQKARKAAKRVSFSRKGQKAMAKFLKPAMMPSVVKVPKIFNKRKLGSGGMLALSGMAPAAIGTKFRQTNRAVRVTHRELLTTFTGTSSVYECLQIFMNPGLPGTYPWLSIMAPAFEHYKVNNITIEWSPSCPTTTTGKVLLTVARDVYDTPFTSMQAQISYARSAAMPVWQMSRCSMGKSDYTKKFLVRTGTVYPPPGSSVDLHFYDPCVFFLGFEQVSSGQYAGEVYINYDISFYTPTPNGATSLVDLSYFQSWSYVAGQKSNVAPGTLTNPYPAKFSGSVNSFFTPSGLTFDFPPSIQYAIVRINQSASVNAYGLLANVTFVNLNAATNNNLTLPGGGVPSPTSLPMNYDMFTYAYGNALGSQWDSAFTMFIQIVNGSIPAGLNLFWNTGTNTSTASDFDLAIQWIADEQANAMFNVVSPLSAKRSERKICVLPPRQFHTNLRVTDGKLYPLLRAPAERPLSVQQLYRAHQEIKIYSDEEQEPVQVEDEPVVIHSSSASSSSFSSNSWFKKPSEEKRSGSKTPK